MAVKVKSKSGKTVTLLNPSEKGSKYARELKENYKRTNALSFKLDKDGKGMKLTDVERAYRSGYLDAQKDSAKCYNAAKRKK